MILENIKVISPLDKLNSTFNLLILDGKIARLTREKILLNNTKSIDLTGKTAIPGLFDMHTHFREPGQTYKEDIFTGSQAAANGGFTGVLLMPNTDPPVDSPEIIDYIYEKSKDNIVDIYTTACLTKERKGLKLSNIENCLKAGAIAFTDDGSPVLNSELLNQGFKYSAKYKFPFLQHAENYNLHSNGVVNEGKISKLLKLNGIPEESESSVISSDILLLKQNRDALYHIQHISCEKSIKIIKEAKCEGLNVSVEVCPHHFILDEEACINFGTNAKMNPPLRTKKDVEAILNAISENIIDVIASDHAPHSNEEKLLPMSIAPFGIIGLETTVSLTYTYLLKKRYITIERMIELLSINPRKVLGLEQIKIREGEKANLTILDTECVYRINKNKFYSKSRNTPFDNFEVQCKPFAIINNNNIFFSDL
ncbi:MAG: dihydroorotase [Ignavibacteria bacterium]|nr:dihydroorotase [Ignavibacteria bacterium]